MTVHHTMSRIYRTWGRSPLVSPARTIWPPGHSSISRKQLVTGGPKTANLGTRVPVTAARQTILNFSQKFIFFRITMFATKSIKSIQESCWSNISNQPRSPIAFTQRLRISKRKKEISSELLALSIRLLCNLKAYVIILVRIVGHTIHLYTKRG